MIAGLRTIALTFAAFTALAVAVSPAGSQSAPKPGGSLIIAVENEPSSLAPHLTTDTPTFMVVDNIYNALVLLDENLQPQPDLAQSWTVSPDGRVFTFQLATNAKWHDGKPVTAADVEFTFNDLIAKNHPRAGTWWPNVEFGQGHRHAYLRVPAEGALRSLPDHAGQRAFELSPDHAQAPL